MADLITNSASEDESKKSTNPPSLAFLWKPLQTSVLAFQFRTEGNLTYPSWIEEAIANGIVHFEPPGAKEAHPWLRVREHKMISPHTYVSESYRMQPGAWVVLHASRYLIFSDKDFQEQFLPESS